MHSTKHTDRELIAIIVGEKTADSLYHGSITNMLREAANGDTRYARLAAAHELVNRALLEGVLGSDVLSSPMAVRDYLRLKLIAYEYEVFLVIFLDAQNRVLAIEEMFRGTLTQTSVYPREIVKRSLARNAGGVIFCHNHPSGAPEPSAADRSLTRALGEALALIDVRVVDHIIVAGNQFVSFAERGML